MNNTHNTQQHSAVFYDHGHKYNCYVHGNPRYRLTATIDGKRRAVYGDGEKDAQSKLRALLDLHHDGVNLDNRTATVGDVIYHWVYAVKRNDGDIKASSFKNIDSWYRNHIKGKSIERIKIAQLSTANVQAYVNEEALQGCSRTTLQKILMFLRCFNKWAVNNDYLVKQVVSDIVLPGEYTKHDKCKKAIDIFDEEERSSILAYLTTSHHEYKEAILLDFATGLRAGELVALRWQDIDLQNRTLTVSHALSRQYGRADMDGSAPTLATYVDAEPKTVNAYRTIPLLQSTVQMLSDYKHKQELYFMEHGLGRPMNVFYRHGNEPLNTQVLYTAFLTVLKRSGVKHHKFHAIRHTFATEAIRRGVNVKDVQKLMGHSNINTTYIYVQSDDASKRDAIERMGAIM